VRGVSQLACHNEPAPNNITNGTSNLRTARGVWLRPSGRRTLGLWVVRCPFTACRGQHVHRGGPNGVIRTAGCGDGRYRVAAR
jgi:hypothetical protein